MRASISDLLTDWQRVRAASKEDDKLDLDN
eukprot:SAG11_NODE_3670_length_2295_cov_2.541894_1_plen_29_part_10